MAANSIQAILFDFGGVLAEEGYREGLFAIARKNGLVPEVFFATATEIIYGCGYVTGSSNEREFWQLVREQTGISGSDAELTNEILSRFILRPAMLDAVDALRRQGIAAHILSDQTDWLDRLNQRDHFFHHFDIVYNSFHRGKSKRDASLFSDIAMELALAPEQTLFVDDNPGNTERARARGVKTHLFTSQDKFLADCKRRGLL